MRACTSIMQIDVTPSWSAIEDPGAGNGRRSRIGASL